MSDTILQILIFIVIMCWYGFLYIKESIDVDPLSRFPLSDFNVLFTMPTTEEFVYSSGKIPIIIKWSYAVTVFLACLGLSCSIRIRQHLAQLHVRQGMYGWLLSEFRAEMKAKQEQSELYLSEQLLRVHTMASSWAGDGDHLVTSNEASNVKVTLSVFSTCYTWHHQS